VVEVENVRVEAEGLQQGRVHGADSVIRGIERTGAAARTAGATTILSSTYIAGSHDAALPLGRAAVRAACRARSARVQSCCGYRRWRPGFIVEVLMAPANSPTMRATRAAR
jgi:hypothetical protein